MLQYAASETMLVDCLVREHTGDFSLHVPAGQRAYLQFSDGREGFFDSGDHRFRRNRSAALFRRAESVRLYRFNLSDHIELHLSDIVQVMEQMLRSVDPELRLYAPVEVQVDMDVTVRIEDCETLLQIMMEKQDREENPVLDRDSLAEYLEEKLHYTLEEALNTCKRQRDISIFSLSGLSEDVECALIGELCDLLESLSLEMVAARISQMVPTEEGLQHFHGKQEETLAWYNQVQMDRFSRRKSRQSKRRTG